MWSGLKSKVGDFFEVLVLLALVPIIVALWAGFAAAAGGTVDNNWILVGTLGNNTALGSAATHGYYAIVINNTVIVFNWDGSTTTFNNNLTNCNVTWGSSYTSGNGAPTSIIKVTNGKLFIVKSYSVSANTNYHYTINCNGAEVPPDPSLKLYYYNATGTPTAPPVVSANGAANLVNALFVIVLLAIASAVVGKVAG